MDISTEYVHALDGAEEKKVRLKDDNVKNLLVKKCKWQHGNVEVLAPLSDLLELPNNNNIEIHWMLADSKGCISPTRLYLYNIMDDCGRGRRNGNKNTLSLSVQQFVTKKIYIITSYLFYNLAM